MEGGWGSTYELLRELLLNSEHRGRDATGFVACTVPLDSPQRRGLLLSKQPLNAGDFIEQDKAFCSLGHRRCTAFLGHVRAATHGDPKAPGNINNHPFVSEDRTWFLVHNGVITNHEELADKFALKMQSQCDSEVLLRLSELDASPADGLTACLQEAKGSMAVAVYDSVRRSMWLARNSGRPLWLLRLAKERRWFFASTETILLESVRNTFGTAALKRIEYLAPIPAHRPIEMREDGSLFAVWDGESKTASSSGHES